MRTNRHLAIARAVARSSRARLLHPDNTAGRAVPLDAAVSSGHAYFVTPRPDLLVVDLDLPEDPREAADVAAAFDLLIDAAARAGVPHLTFDSGRPGHRHAYLVTGTGGARTRLEQWARRHGLDVRDRGIRPPGSPHRDPAVSIPTPSDPDRAVAVLSRAPSPAATGAMAGELNPLTLPSRVRLAVRHGHNRAGYASPSHARMALAVAIYARGGTPGLLASVLDDQRSPLGQTYRARPARWRHAEITRLWDKAATWTANGPKDHRPHLRRITAAAHHAPWKGSGGGSDLAVLETLLRTGLTVGTKVVGVALADVAIGAGVSRDTARASLLRLQRNGWLRVVAAETAYTTRSYELLLPAHHRDVDTEADVSAVDDLGDLGADIARWRALGKVTMRVARTVAEQPSATARELGEQLSMTTRQVAHHIRKLTKAQLVRARDGAVTLIATTAHLEHAAQAAGTAGMRRAHQELLTTNRAVRAAARRAFRQAHLQRLTPAT